MRAGKDTQMEHTIIENGFTYHLAADGMYYPDLKRRRMKNPATADTGGCGKYSSCNTGTGCSWSFC